MSQQRRTPYITLVSALLLSLLIGMFLFGRKRRAKQTSSEKVVTHSAETSPEDALAYWTADKKRDAKPAPMPVINVQPEKRSSRSNQHE